MNAKIMRLANDPIELALAEQAIELAKRQQRWNTIKTFYRPIIAALQAIGVEPRLSNEIDVSFAGDAHKLAAVVRILRAAGMQTTGARPKHGDTSWAAYYESPECQTKVWLYFTSSVCRQIKVGTKTVEVDVYETRCGSDISGIVEELPAPLAPVAEVSFDSDIPF